MMIMKKVLIMLQIMVNWGYPTLEWMHWEGWKFLNNSMMDKKNTEINPP